MAYSPRSLTEISQSIRGAFRQYLPGTDATVRQNVIYVIAKVLALLTREFELRFEWVYRQIFLSTATDPAHIRMHAADYRIYQKPASPAVGRVAGTARAGATYPSGIRFLAGGVTYVSTATFTAASTGAFSAPIISEQVGAGANREAGAVLLLADASLYPDLSSEVVVSTDGLGGGADVEAIESLKARALARKAQPPQGGSLLDYERFALDVAGVVKAWAHEFANGIGTILIHVLFKDRPDLIPTAADLAVIQASIDARRMIRMDDVIVAAPVRAPVAVTIANLRSDTPDIRAAIDARIRSVLYDRVRPGIASDPFTLSRSWISEAISTTVGEDSHILVQPAGDITYVGGQMPVLGIVTYA